MLQNCNEQAFEFTLAFNNYPIQKEEVRALLDKQCEEARRKSISDLLSFIDRFKENKVNLEYVQDKSFKNEFVHNIEPEIRFTSNVRMVEAPSQTRQITEKTLKFAVIPMASLISSLIMIGEGTPFLLAAGGGSWIYLLGRAFANHLDYLSKHIETDHL